MGYGGGPAAALLEVLDPAQNHTSGTTTWRSTWTSRCPVPGYGAFDTIPGPLLDRMEAVTCRYTEQEKIAIARDHLRPRQFDRAGLTADDVTIADEALGAIAGEHREAGVRQLERALARILRKVAATASSAAPVRITANDLRPFLGRARLGAGVGRTHGDAGRGHRTRGDRPAAMSSSSRRPRCRRSRRPRPARPD